MALLAHLKCHVHVCNAGV